MHSQQTFLMETEALKSNKALLMNRCPRKEAIKALSDIIAALQEQDHAIILTIDANQTPLECQNANGIKPHSIEWLRMEHGLDDPFLLLHNKRPNTTTNTPHRDIDYILTYGIQPQTILILPPDFPTASDHRGICLDISAEVLFSAKYSQLSNQQPRKLTLNNVKAKETYKKYILQQMEEHRIWDQVLALYNKAISLTFTDDDEITLNKIDTQITDIFRSGERLCAKDNKMRDSWSPQLLIAGRTLSYWENKVRMLIKRLINWNRLTRLRESTQISESDHQSLCIRHAKEHR